MTLRNRSERFGPDLVLIIPLLFAFVIFLPHSVTAGGSVKITCSDSGITYSEWTGATQNCANTPTITGSTNNNDANTCISLSTGSYVKVDCNGAAQVAISSMMIALLAVLANRVQKLL
jgi:hypothetical protein